MNKSDQFRTIEERLRQQARTLQTEMPLPPSAGLLLAKHRRRMRRRTAVGVAVSGVAVLLLLAANSLMLPLHNMANHDKADIPSEHKAQPVLPRVAVTSGGPKLQNPGITPSAPPPLMPVVFTQLVDGVEQVTAVGVYVPEQVQQLDMNDLTPQEQYAVRTLLGLDDQGHDPI